MASLNSNRCPRLRKRPREENVGDVIDLWRYGRLERGARRQIHLSHGQMQRVGLASPAHDDVRSARCQSRDIAEAVYARDPWIARLEEEDLYSPQTQAGHREMERVSGGFSGRRRVSWRQCLSGRPAGQARPRLLGGFHTPLQPGLLEGPEARAHDARGFFLAGNHDWGNLMGPDGIKRLGNMDRALRSYAQDGIDVRLTPSAGNGGPQSFRLGDFATLITLDTSWWMQAGNDPLRDLLLDGLGDALSATDDRLNVVVAHSPLPDRGRPQRLARPEVRPILAPPAHRRDRPKPNLEPVQGAARRTRRRVRAHGPTVHLRRGHDHSLQLFEAGQPSDPTYSIVSGAGSKLTAVAEAEDLVWASRALGFMRILFRVDGGAEVYVEVIDEALSDCEERFNARESCLEHGVDAFRTVYSKRLR